MFLREILHFEKRLMSVPLTFVFLHVNIVYGLFKMSSEDPEQAPAINRLSIITSRL